MRYNIPTDYVITHNTISDCKIEIKVDYSSNQGIINRIKKITTKTGLLDLTIKKRNTF